MGRCFDIAKERLDVGDNYVVKEDLLHDFMRVCDTLDKLCDDFCLSDLTVSVDRSTLDIKMSFLCDGIEIDTRKANVYGKDNKMLVIMKVANKVSYKNVDKGDTLKIEFSFPSIWERK